MKTFRVDYILIPKKGYKKISPMNVTIEAENYGYAERRAGEYISALLIKNPKFQYMGGYQINSIDFLGDTGNTGSGGGWGGHGENPPQMSCSDILKNIENLNHILRTQNLSTMERIQVEAKLNGFRELYSKNCKGGSDSSGGNPRFSGIGGEYDNIVNDLF